MDSRGASKLTAPQATTHGGKVMWFEVIFCAICVGCAMISHLHKKHLEKVEDAIVKTRIVDVSHRGKGYTKLNNRSAIARAATGGMLFGKNGAAFEAYTAKRDVYISDDDLVYFRVWWRDGDKTIETVKRGSDRYRLFLEYLED